MVENVERTDVFGTYTDRLYKALFYLYAAPASQMTLRLYGEQTLFGAGPAEVIYDIPLSKILPKGKTDIERNTCYTLVVEDIDISDSGSFDVTVGFEVDDTPSVFAGALFFAGTLKLSWLISCAP